MAYMVKTLGSFLVWRPFGKGVFEKKDTICVKCFLPDDGHGKEESTPFLANAIIALFLGL